MFGFYLFNPLFGGRGHSLEFTIELTIWKSRTFSHFNVTKTTVVHTSSSFSESETTEEVALDTLPRLRVSSTSTTHRNSLTSLRDAGRADDTCDTAITNVHSRLLFIPINNIDTWHGFVTPPNSIYIDCPLDKLQLN